MEVYRKVAQNDSAPCIIEMSGKNAAIIMPSAKIEDAAEGVMRSAFGFRPEMFRLFSCLRPQAGIKPFMEALIEATKAQKIGSPVERDTFLGPLINEQALNRTTEGGRPR